MSEARLKANVIKILGNPAVKYINFRISGHHFYNERFKKVGVAVKAGLIQIIPFDGAAHPDMVGGYNPRSNKLILNKAIGSGGSVPRHLQRNVVHEAFHAICDVDMIEGISPTQEEACAYIAAAIYEKYHFGRSQYVNAHPMTEMIKILKGNPGYELQGDPVFGELYQRAYDKYRKNDPDWGHSASINNGL